MSTLTPQEVITWLRTNGHKLLDAADAVEAAFAQREGAAFAPPEAIDASQCRTRFRRTVTPELIRERLREGHSRVPQLAKEFGASEEMIRSIVANSDNGIVVKDRGWLYLREDLNGG